MTVGVDLDTLRAGIVKIAKPASKINNNGNTSVVIGALKSVQKFIRAPYSRMQIS